MKAHILVVDDENDVVHMVSRVLVEHGYEVTQAASGERALEVLSETEVDLLIVDRDLPQLSGREVCEQVRRQPSTRDLPIVRMTAVHISLSDARAVVGSGVDAYLFRPFMSETLLSNVSWLLSRRQ